MTATSPGRAPFILVALCALLALAAFWGLWSFWNARDAAIAAANDLTEARRIASRLVALRGTGPTADTRKSSSDVRLRIAQAMESGELPSEALASIDELSSRRIGSSAYQEQPTQVVFRSVTLKQLLTLLKTTLADARDLRLTALRLSAPEQGNRATVAGWTAEATISRIGLEPESPTQARRPAAAANRE
jgi:hypothetical protein